MSPPRRNASRPLPGSIYLDYQATTPVDPRVLEAMLPWFTERFGNPHSAGHGFGAEAAEAVERARAEIAAVIGAEPREIIFTSGATESNNLAIKGAARFHIGDRRRIVTLATEHKCVLESVAALGAEGFEVDILPVEPSGRVDLDRLAAALNERTLLVSVMAANNEIGVIQDMAAIGKIARAKGVLFHSDAAQAFGKIPLDVNAMGIDLLSISGHKIYAPKGIGALYVRYKPRVRLQPLMSGGGQERGLRSGTLSPPLCVALGAAASIYAAEGETERQRCGALARLLFDGLKQRLPEIQLNGDPVHRLPNNLNIAFSGTMASVLMEALPDIALSAGSACSSAAADSSYVLRAIGLTPGLAVGSLRLSIGRFTTEDDIDRAIERIADAVTGMRPCLLPRGQMRAT